MADSLNPEFEREQQQARDGLRSVSKLRQKLDLLTEHVESRKEALEEEIQEHLHESLANARDSMERIEENIAPKVEKAIRTKFQEIDRKMKRLNEEGAEMAQEQLVKATPDITKKILEDLDKLVAENTRFVKIEIFNEIKDELNKSIQSAIDPVCNQVKQDLPAYRNMAIAALALASAALLGIVWLYVK